MLPVLGHSCNEIYHNISCTYKQHDPQGRPPQAAGKQTNSSEVSGDISQQCRIGTGRQITIWRVHWNTGYAHVIWMVEALGLQTICLGPMPNALHTHLRFQRLFPPVFKNAPRIFIAAVRYAYSPALEKMEPCGIKGSSVLIEQV